MNAFANVLKAQMKISGVSIEKLCEGLCSQSMFTRLCNGERNADKLLRDRLMQRLGVSDTRNESFLFRDEYEGWKQRQQIVNCINRVELKQAEELLADYKRRVSVENKLELQFCLVMEIQIMILQGCEENMFKEQIERALKLTVPNIDKKSLHDLMFSEQEMDLVLEYARYCHPEKLAEYCRTLLEYIKQHISDEYLQAKILPKTVYYLCEAERSNGSLDENMLMRYCNKAITCLRDTQRLYYFVELLCEREKLYESFIAKAKAKNEEINVETFTRMQEENALWKQTLEEMYRECGVSPRLNSSCYLYLQKDTFCINDIIYKRRTMLGMTRKQLCEGICSEKTIARVELTDGKMQLPIVREVLGRLGMSGEYQRVDIVTSNPEALKLVRDIATYGHNREYEKELEAVEKLEKLIPMEEPINRQYIRRVKILLRYDLNEISKDEAVEGLIDALQYTVSLKCIEKDGNLCLTKAERACLMNVVFLRGINELTVYHKILWSICEECEKSQTIMQNIGMYEFIMAHIASVLGNVGNYEKSNAISQIIIRENALVRRFGNIADGIYNIAYNYKEQKPKDYDDKIWRNHISKSALLFCITKCYNLQKILETELLKD